MKFPLAMNRDLFKQDLPRMSMVDMVVERIKTLLIEQKLKPGDILPSENVLAESLKVSRGSIREAMKILSAFGIVEIRRGDGTYITTSVNKKLFNPLLFKILVDTRDYRELIDLRAMMERGIVDLVIRHATDEDLEELSRVLKRMEELSTTEKEGHAERDKADLEFHKVLGRLCKNSMIENIYSFVMELFAPTINATYGLEVHRQLLQALKERNVERAEQIIDQHTRIWCQVNGIQY
ncbi:MAG: FadR family transcriptional regulator [Spirochaetes bacterium]|nr:FadR family transcriptional regulator [Spirochaetota bacterium]